MPTPYQEHNQDYEPEEPTHCSDCFKEFETCLKHGVDYCPSCDVECPACYDEENGIEYKDDAGQ